MDKQRNSSSNLRDDMNTSGGSEYLTLKKFGWTEQQQPQETHTTLVKPPAAKSILSNSRNSSRRSSYQNNKENNNPDTKLGSIGF